MIVCICICMCICILSTYEYTCMICSSTVPVYEQNGRIFFLVDATCPSQDFLRLYVFSHQSFLWTMYHTGGAIMGVFFRKEDAHTSPNREISSLLVMLITNDPFCCRIDVSDQVPIAENINMSKPSCSPMSGYIHITCYTCHSPWSSEKTLWITMHLES